jgi:hypothetical protein
VLTAIGKSPEEYFTPQEKLEQMPEHVRNGVMKHELSQAVKAVDKLVDAMNDHLGVAVAKMSTEDLKDVPVEALLPPAPVIREGSGYQACVTKKAKEEGLTETALASEREDLRQRRYEEVAAKRLHKEGKEATPERVAAVVEEMQEHRARLNDALAVTRGDIAEAKRKVGDKDIPIPDEMPDVDTIVGIIKRKHEWQKNKSELRRMKNEILDSGKTDASIIPGEDADPEQMQAEIDKRLASTPEDELDKALADELSKDQMQKAAYDLAGVLDDEEDKNGSLSGHIGVGRYNSFNLINQTVTGEPIAIDRAVADVLGTSGVAQIVAESWRKSLSEEDLQAAREGLINHFKGTQADKAEQALSEYGELMDKAESMRLPDIGDADDLVAAQYVLDEKADLLNEARSRIGVTYGELSATAELIKALDYPQENPELHILLGKVSPEQAISMARMSGLSRGETGINGDLSDLWEYTILRREAC